MSIDYGKIKAPARERVLQLLSDLRWHSWRELANIGGVRYSARLLELKRLGYEFTDQESNNGDGKKYRLISMTKGKPKEKKVKVFLEEEDVDALVGFIVAAETFAYQQDVTLPRSRRTLNALRGALSSFRTNKSKL